MRKSLVGNCRRKPKGNLREHFRQPAIGNGTTENMQLAKMETDRNQPRMAHAGR